MKINDQKLVFFTALAILALFFGGMFRSRAYESRIDLSVKSRLDSVERDQKQAYLSFTSNVLNIVASSISNSVSRSSSSPRDSAKNSILRPDISIGRIGYTYVVYISGRAFGEGDLLRDGVILRVAPDGVLLDSGLILVPVAESSSVASASQMDKNNDASNNL